MPLCVSGNRSSINTVVSSRAMIAVDSAISIDRLGVAQNEEVTYNCECRKLKHKATTMAKMYNLAILAAYQRSLWRVQGPCARITQAAMEKDSFRANEDPEFREFARARLSIAMCPIALLEG